MRYDYLLTRVNGSPLYSTQFENRGVRFIKQYPTVTLRYPSVSEIRELELVGHVWKVGDKYYKLAHKYYGDSKLWWVIAWFNKKPTEAHVKIGYLLKIPTPLEKILNFYEL